MGFLIFLIIAISVFGVLSKLYMKLHTKWCKSKTCLVGKTVVVTGANTGIGYETALDLACRGAKVILACRDKKRGESACLKIIRATGNPNVIVKMLDLASFESVRKFAEEINETEERLDVLINNAGALGNGDVKSTDGHVLVMQVNYLSSFLLTHLLLDLLKKSGNSRVINVASSLAKLADLDPDKIGIYPGSGLVYNNSKLCNILFTKELAKRLRGSKVTTYSLHPGLIKTEILRYFEGLKGFFWRSILSFSKTPEEGAQTTIYVAVARDIEDLNGEHFEECARVKPYKTVVSGLEEKLWEKTKELIKMKAEEVKI